MTLEKQVHAVGATRRTVVRGAAWSVPVIAAATAAPAFAASPCSTPVSMSTSWETNRYTGWWGLTDRGWGFWRPSSGPAASYLTQDPDGSGRQLPIRMDLSISYGSNTQAAADQLAVTTQNVGGTQSRGLTLHQRPRDASQQSSNLLDRNKSVVSISLSRQVSSLTFTMTDIDSASNDFRDALGIAGATIASYSIQNSDQVRGTGTVADPFRVRPTNSVVDNFSENGGNVTVTLTNVSTFQLHYWNFQPSGAGDDQKVYLTNFQINYLPC